MIKVSNLNNIVEDFTKVYEKENEDEYENVYNRINIYFNSIINEIKLSYNENMKILYEKDIQSQRKNNVKFFLIFRKWKEKYYHWKKKIKKIKKISI